MDIDEAIKAEVDRYRDARKAVQRVRDLSDPTWRSHSGRLVQDYLDTIEAFIDDTEAGRIEWRASISKTTKR